VIILTIQSLPIQLQPNIYLGPTGTVLVVGLMLLLLFLVWRQRNWKSAADAAVAEMGVHKAAAERLRAAHDELLAEVTRLQTKTDLKPLIESLNLWVVEGRTRFESAEKRLNDVHCEQTRALTAVLEEQQRLRDGFAVHMHADSEAQLRIATLMGSLEQRLSMIAVRIGVLEWSPPSAGTAGAGS
jgi:hypothetical protein